MGLMNLTKAERENLYKIVLTERWAGKQFLFGDFYNRKNSIVFRIDEDDCKILSIHMIVRPGMVIFFAPGNSKFLRKFNAAGTDLLNFMLALAE